jgi:hypothetical protein
VRQQLPIVAPGRDSTGRTFRSSSDSNLSDAHERHRRDDGLRRVVQLEGVSIRTGKLRSTSCWPKTAPVHLVGDNDGRSQPGNPRLRAQRLEIIAEARHQEVVGRGAHEHAHRQRQGDREPQQRVTHAHGQGLRPGRLHYTVGQDLIVTGRVTLS